MPFTDTHRDVTPGRETHSLILMHILCMVCVSFALIKDFLSH